MALAVLFETPETDDQRRTWAFVNMAHHRDINRRIFERFGTNLTESVLDPFDWDNPTTWLYKHQLMHQHQNQVLGIKGFDLTSVKWDDPEDFGAWLSAHANEHVQAGTILGLG